MSTTADYLLSLSDAELIAWWGMFFDYPTPDRKQRRRLDALLAGTIQAEKLTGVFKPVRLLAPADLMVWLEPAPKVKSHRRGGRGVYPIESDRGEWWPDSAAARDALGVSHTNCINAACHGRHKVKGRTLFYSRHATRPASSRHAA